MNTMTESPALARVNTLLTAGYTIDPAGIQPGSDAVWLEHPNGNRPAHPKLIASSDGMVVGTQPADGSAQLRIPADDADRFLRFVGAVPKPDALSMRASVPVWALALLSAALVLALVL